MERLYTKLIPKSVLRVCRREIRLWSGRNRCSLCSAGTINRRQSSGKSAEKLTGEIEDISAIRNIGIMAHIDAGKTTTTERMLFYSGRSRALGDVDDGDTVTDYMEQERARGITITSAAVTFPWLGHRVNLIDTPGHVDFTMEVERCLRVLDGAVTVLDASAGVEAQSLTVWNQAERHGVPLLIYLNKMDKPRADVHACLNSIAQKFRVPPLLTQIPLYQHHSSSKLPKQDRGSFVGAVDLLRLERMQWPSAKDDQSLGRNFVRAPLEPESDHQCWMQALDARKRLVEATADLDDSLADAYLSGDGDALAVPAAMLEAALRRVCLARTGLPVLLGSSKRNVGVQPLLDAVVRYLPSPLERQHPFVAHYAGDLCALAFKVIHDKQRGRLTFLRLYSGQIRPGQRLFNLSRGITEKVNRLMNTRADNFEEELNRVDAGAIALVSGLKDVVTGDTLVESQASAQRARHSFQQQHGDKNGDGALLAGVEVPQPVFFCSVEPASMGQQKPLEVALVAMQLEDPSLRVTVDEDTGQTVIAGMGELHLDIVKDRLLREHKVNAYLGELQVAYHETPESAAERRHQLDRTLADKRHHVCVHLRVEHAVNAGRQTALRLLHSRENQENLAALRPHHRQAIESGVAAALSHGPLAGYPVIDVAVGLSYFECAPGTSVAMVAAAASQCVRLILSQPPSAGGAGVRLLEPVSELDIAVPEQHVHAVLADLSARRSRVLRVEARHDGQQLISALAPMAELLGYATALRTVTSGMAVFSMTFHSMASMSSYDQAQALQRIRGG